MTEKDKSLTQEFWDLLVEKWQFVWQWYLPKKDQPLLLQILLPILKFPVLLLVVLVSPIALLILAFTFVVVL